MKSELPTPPVLTLQEKLDRIAHDRDVLSLQRALADAGLREGDPVQSVVGGAAGHLLIARDKNPPRLLVRCDDGSFGEYNADGWRRVR